MKYYEFTTEARRGGDLLNPKPSAAAQLRAMYDQTTDTAGGTKNLFISLTELEKLGINPNSEHESPLAIYAYPVEYVLQTVGESEDMKLLPYAGDKPWINVFSVDPRGILKLDELSPEQEQHYYQQILQYVAQAAQQNGRSPKSYLKSAREVIEFAEDDADEGHLPAGRLWHVIMEISNILARINRSNKQWRAFWNKLLRELGIRGMMDPGLGVIWLLEKTQAAFFDPTMIKNVQRIANKYPQSIVSKKQAQGQLAHRRTKTAADTFKNFAAPQDLAAWLNQRPLDTLSKYLPYVRNTQVRAAVLDHNPQAIKYIRKPTEQEQMSVLSRDIALVSEISYKDLNGAAVISVLRSSADPRAATERLMANNPAVPENVQLYLLKQWGITPFYSFTRPAQSAVNLVLKLLPGPMTKTDYDKIYGVISNRQNEEDSVSLPSKYHKMFRRFG